MPSARSILPIWRRVIKAAYWHLAPLQFLGLLLCGETCCWLIFSMSTVDCCLSSGRRKRLLHASMFPLNQVDFWQCLQQQTFDWIAFRMERMWERVGNCSSDGNQHAPHSLPCQLASGPIKQRIVFLAQSPESTSFEKNLTPHSISSLSDIFGSEIQHTNWWSKSVHSSGFCLVWQSSVVSTEGLDDDIEIEWWPRRPLDMFKMTDDPLTIPWTRNFSFDTTAVVLIWSVGSSQFWSMDSRRWKLICSCTAAVRQH